MCGHRQRVLNRKLCEVCLSVSATPMFIVRNDFNYFYDGDDAKGNPKWAYPLCNRPLNAWVIDEQWANKLISKLALAGIRAYKLPVPQIPV